ncbi:MAG: spoVD 2, partial [Chthoniobacteraceae bacterium]|nr:spoVD 2 [Chthoniobacteraceae bacterium]
QIERYLNKHISGTPGMRVMERNVKGVIDHELKVVSPKQGNNVMLTIDARIEYIAERALRDAHIGRGAVVVVNPKNGDILAMVSVPSYDPNDFIPNISPADWKHLNDDETDPLTNRAILSYAPGSTFKTVSALAGLKKGLTGSTTFNCSGGVTYGGKYMKCWVVDKHMAPHGSITLPDALKYSCNAFFYQWGCAARIENIDAMGDALGLGKRTGVPLSGESPGVLPGPDWLKQVEPNAKWTDGYTANASIGQGSVEASPLQMAMVVSTIANRGISYQPRLIHRVLDQEGNDVRDEDGNMVAPHEPKVRADLHTFGISNDQIELVRRGMWKVVNDVGGTGKKAQIKGVEVAGKTGTAQFWRETNEGRAKVKDNHTWFISFAPYEDPKFAICVFVQGAQSGGGVSAPIAQKVLEESLALEKGYDPGVKFLEPAVGSFTPILAVDYKKSELAPEMQADLETAEHSEPAEKKKREKQVKATPSIRAVPDQGGKVQPRVAPAKPPVDKHGFFERFFGGKKSAAPSPAPPTGRPVPR